MKKPTTLYRFLTGPDDASFCHKITKALNEGWELHGNPNYAPDTKSGELRCGQAVIKYSQEAYNPDRKLGEY
ncbi:MAG: DUF1737 domain-containing protein [Nitratireductor sp.]